MFEENKVTQENTDQLEEVLEEISNKLTSIKKNLNEAERSVADTIAQHKDTTSALEEFKEKYADELNTPDAIEVIHSYESAITKFEEAIDLMHEVTQTQEAMYKNLIDLYSDIYKKITGKTDDGNYYGDNTLQ